MSDPELRRRAEAKLAETIDLDRDLEILPRKEVADLLHELNVHQIELEMQNEELRRAELELDAQRLKYFDLYDLAPVGYLTLDAAGSIVEANLRAASLLGVPRSQLAHQSLSRWIAAEDQDSYYLHRKKLAASNADRAIELRIDRDDGSRLWIHFETAAVISSTAATSLREPTPPVRVTLSDITAQRRAQEEREQLQAELQHSRKLESLGRLASGVAHHFNNTLAAILARAEIAQLKVDPGEPLHAELEVICEVVGRGAEISRSLLSFARKQPFAPRLLDLNAAMTGLLGMLRVLLGMRIEIVLEPSADLWPVRVDPGQIEQIVINLCLNARDAIAIDGKITLETRNAVLGPREHPRGASSVGGGDYVVLEVKDNGSGMNSEILDHLFEPFFTTKDIGQGTGLGLAAVHGIVEQSKGFIEVRSAPGKGSTFEIYLPRCGDVDRPTEPGT